jgi:hypothetical protein
MTTMPSQTSRRPGNVVNHYRSEVRREHRTTSRAIAAAAVFLVSAAAIPSAPADACVEQQKPSKTSERPTAT